jgi:pimeloyl-ACP methyl ester carboxylesterase
VTKSDDNQPQSVRCSAGGLSLHAIQRNPSGNPAVLFLHGWLDHCHSFDWLCDELPASWRQIALDFRGMGQSAHLTGGGLYNFTDYLADMEGALLSLGVEAVHLVGHSLGGSVALAYAAARPERVASVTSIESLGPSGGKPDRAVERLRGFVADLAKQRRKRTYPDVEAAAARVRENNSSLSERAAFHLALFGTQPASSGGVEFTFDPAHRWRFGFAYDEEQLLAILGAVRAKVQVIHGSHGFTFDDGQMKARLSRLGSPLPVTVAGGHHVHMDQPREVAVHIERFIASNS